MTRQEMAKRYEEMVELFLSGTKITAISAKYNVSIATVSRALRKSGVPPQASWASQRIKRGTKVQPRGPRINPVSYQSKHSNDY